jgi:hypothetical protein
MIQVRKAVAVLALAALGVLILRLDPRDPGGSLDRTGAAVWVLLAPLLITMAGLLRERYWSRWLALAAGIAVLPWAFVLVVAPGFGMDMCPQQMALGASALLLLSLVGRTMFERYEGRADQADWAGRRMTLVRWTIICNVASVLALYLFVAAYDYRAEWHLLVPALLLVVLLLGLLMLAHQRTAGILLVALCCVLLLPAGAYFVATEARTSGEGILFAAIFLPGILTGWATLLVFGKPMLRYLRSG